MIEIKHVQFDNEYSDKIRYIRHTVFTQEQHVDPDIEFDGKDEVASHVLIFIEGEPAATGRMLDDGHIGRVAVLKKFRGKGIGKKVMLALEQEAIKRGYERIYLGAQIHALDFYSSLGYMPYGEVYEEANIQHQSMEKYLTNS